MIYSITKKLVVLVCNRNSAERCLKELYRLREATWIVCDVGAQMLLYDNGIGYRTEQDLFLGEENRLREDEELARRLSETWFNPLSRIEKNEDVIESCYTRPFLSYFLVILRAVHLLERIFIQYRSHRIVTCDSVSSIDPTIRWTENESPLPHLLRLMEKGFHFEYEILNAESTLVSSPRKRGSIALWIPVFAGMTQVFSFLNRYFHKAEVLLWGNPSILSPVGKELWRQFKMKSFRLRPQNILLSARSFKSFFKEKEIYELLQKSEVFTLRGMDLLPIVWQRIKMFYEKEYPHSKAIIHNVCQFMRRMKPKVLLADEDVTPLSKMVVRQAGKRGVRTLVVSHGLPGLPHGFIPLSADFIAVWGDFEEQRLKSWGIPAERILKTGNPKYDSLCRDYSEEGLSLRKKWMKKWDWDPLAPLVLVTPDSFNGNGLELFFDEMKTPEEVLMQAKCFIQVAREMPELRIIYKIKQGKWDGEFYERVARWQRGLPPNIKWVEQGTAVELIKASDVVFSGWASSGLEAILLKKPLFLLHFLPYKEIFPFTRYGFQYKLNSPLAVMEVCRKFSRGQLPLRELAKSQECLVRPFLLSRDGRAAYRIASFLEALL